MKMNLNEFKNGKIAATYDSSSETIFQHFGKTQNFKIYTIEDGKIVKSEVMDTTILQPTLKILESKS